jgi:hypothetical protein
VGSAAEAGGGSGELDLGLDTGAPGGPGRSRPRGWASRWIEARTGWSIRKFVKTARGYRTIQIQAGDRVIAAAPATCANPSQRSTTPGCTLNWANSGYTPCRQSNLASRWPHSVDGSENGKQWP